MSENVAFASLIKDLPPLIFVAKSNMYMQVHLLQFCSSLLHRRLSGLIVDVFGDIAVIASSAAWVEKYKPEIEAFIGKISGINHINWRPSVDILKEEGLEVSNLKEMQSDTCPRRTKVGNFFKQYLLYVSGFLFHFMSFCMNFLFTVYESIFQSRHRSIISMIFVQSLAGSDM